MFCFIDFNCQHSYFKLYLSFLLLNKFLLYWYLYRILINACAYLATISRRQFLLFLYWLWDKWFYNADNFSGVWQKLPFSLQYPFPLYDLIIVSFLFKKIFMKSTVYLVKHYISHPSLQLGMAMWPNSGYLQSE